MNANVTYEAAFTPAGEEVTVIRSARAGISGPSDEFNATDLQAAEHALFNAGYLVASAWSEPSSNGDRWCTLTRMA